MAQSLSPECTPLKTLYDSCFNAWFEGYLERALPPTAPQEQREARSREMAEEFQKRCGEIWNNYRRCVQKAVKERGLEDLLNSAREENPLRDPPPAPRSPSEDGDPS